MELDPAILTPPATPEPAHPELTYVQQQVAPESYVERVLRTQKLLREPLSWDNWKSAMHWFNLWVILGWPAMGLYGAYKNPLRWETGLFAVSYYFITGLGITAGYHRLWAHRSYNAAAPLAMFLAFAGAGSAQGSIKWWSRNHRAHHRYTDTDLDPYGAHRGFFWSHVGWLLLHPMHRSGVADVSDLKKSWIVRFQHKHYLWILLFSGVVVPTLVPWYFWNDAAGGAIYAGILRVIFVQHSTFCVNSLAHWLGETPFDDKHTPRDHLITALVTIGEGYHNFHHQFPMDYRNAIKWYQYDPTKWFIWTCKQIGLASHLKVFPDNEIQKGTYTMELKKLKAKGQLLVWPSDSNDLPIVSWTSFVEQSKTRPLLLIAGFIHDVSTFIDEHPGGASMITRYVGKDATPAFFGGVYDHSNAAHNLLAMKRVGILAGGHPHGEDDYSTPPSQRLRVAEYTDLASHQAKRDQTLSPLCSVISSRIHAKSDFDEDFTR